MRMMSAEKRPENGVPDKGKAPRSVDEVLRDLPLTEDTTCGMWIFRSAFLQKCANKKIYTVIYGIIGCLLSASYAYFSGTITTLEKRFKIPSRTTGIISVGSDIGQLVLSAFISYYAGRGHKPRWVAFGVFTMVINCVMTFLPHYIYGPGRDATYLTTEFGATPDENTTMEVFERQHRQILCRSEPTDSACESSDSSTAIFLLMFCGQLISGIGTSLYYTIGVAYMDDNTKKSKSPALISFSYFLRTLGPAIGYALASYCLNMYISPTLTPTITPKDPRWLGAWWIGWLVIGALLTVFGFLIALFPKTLPRAAARKIAMEERRSLMGLSSEEDRREEHISFKDMMSTFKRLLKNKVLMLNNFSGVFYILGYMPFWLFLAKYIEIMYSKSASEASLITGTTGLIFSAIGILVAGAVITKFRPTARQLSAWNIFIGVISVLGILSYVVLGCEDNDNSLPKLDFNMTCNYNCGCDYVKYTPICSSEGKNYISPCHAGCEKLHHENGTKVFTSCRCIQPEIPSSIMGGTARAGRCPVDCKNSFLIFIVVVCILKFSGATGRASNFLVSMRSVDEQDKSVSIGFGMAILSVFSLAPSPILFGMIIDKTCLLWGKTCTGKGNCWLYDGETLRYRMNLTSVCFIAVGVLFDIGVWVYSKNIKIFDDKIDIKRQETPEMEALKELGEKDPS